MSDAILKAADELAVALNRAKPEHTHKSLRGFTFDETTALQAFWDAALADAAQTLREAIAELVKQDPYMSPDTYRSRAWKRLPDLIDPAKCSRCRDDQHEEECGHGA